MFDSDTLNISMGNNSDYYRNVNYIFSYIFPPERLGKKVPNFKDREAILKVQSSCYTWVGITLETMCPRNFKIDASQFIEPWSLLAAAAVRLVFALIVYALEKFLHLISDSIHFIADNCSSQKDDSCSKYCSTTCCFCCSIDEEEDDEDFIDELKKKKAKRRQILPLNDSEEKLLTPALEETDEVNAATKEHQNLQRKQAVDVVFDDIFSDLSEGAKRMLTYEDKKLMMQKCTQDNSNLENKLISKALTLDDPDVDDGSTNDRVDFLCFKQVRKSKVSILALILLFF